MSPTTAPHVINHRSPPTAPHAPTQHWGRERSLLLSCVHQLLALAFSPREGLHQLASSQLALLLSDGLVSSPEPEPEPEPQPEPEPEP